MVAMANLGCFSYITMNKAISLKQYASGYIRSVKFACSNMAGISGRWKENLNLIREKVKRRSLRTCCCVEILAAIMPNFS